MLKKYKMVLDAEQNPDIAIEVRLFYKGTDISNQVNRVVLDFVMLDSVPENELIRDGLDVGIATPIYDEDTGEMNE